MPANVLVLTWIFFTLSAQVFLAAAFVLGFFPAGSALVRTVFPEWQYQIRPEYEGHLFHVFVALAVFLQAGGLWVLRARLSDGRLTGKLCAFAAVQTAALALLSAAAFKIALYSERAALARWSFAAAAVATVSVQIFWPEAVRWAGAAGRAVVNASARRWMAGAVAAGIAVLLYVPDGQAAVARMFVAEQFHHFDGSFMSASWAFTKGCVLNVDVMTEYGIGIIAVFSLIAKALGGLTYTHVFYELVWAVITYYILCFAFLRRWTGSLALSAITVLFAIKMQMFHPGIDPFIFTLPPALAARFWWDMPFFFCLLGHVRNPQKRWLIMAGCVCGTAIFYMTTTGLCLAAALVFYLTLVAISPGLRARALSSRPQWAAWAGSLVLIVLVAGGLLYMTEGNHLWTPAFRYNMSEFSNYFLTFFGLMPMTETLQNKQALAGAMGFIIPAVYMLTLMITASRSFFGLAPGEEVLTAVISFYGLAMYHYYVARSAPTSYYVVAIPYAFVVCFWVQKALAPLKLRARRLTLLALLGLVLYALLTTHVYLKYPNVLNVSRSPMVDPRVVEPLPDGRSYFNQGWTKLTEAEKLPVNSLGEKNEDLHFEKDFKNDAGLVGYYKRESDFSEDAGLIRRLTGPKEPVALISSFETKMLMQADRRPFFYYQPFVISRPMRLRTYSNSSLYYSGHAYRTLGQLTAHPPRYIFMERIYLDRQDWHLSKDPALIFILQNIFAHYSPSEYGRYLVAMKRNL